MAAGGTAATAAAGAATRTAVEARGGPRAPTACSGPCEDLSAVVGGVKNLPLSKRRRKTNCEKNKYRYVEKVPNKSKTKNTEYVCIYVFDRRTGSDGCAGKCGFVFLGAKGAVLTLLHSLPALSNSAVFVVITEGVLTCSHHVVDKADILPQFI